MTVLSGKSTTNEGCSTAMFLLEGMAYCHTSARLKAICVPAISTGQLFGCFETSSEISPIYLLQEDLA